MKDLRALTRARATKLGFEVCGFASAEAPWIAGERLQAFVDQGRHGDMEWIETTLPRRAHPRGLWDDARTAILVGMNYGPDRDPLARLAERDRACISVYALGDDYHDLVKGRLKMLADFVRSRSGQDAKTFVDTAPLMEKPLAEAAGLGWQGKHTNLVSREFGSWLFLGAILTSAVLEPDAPAEDACGTCRACLDACPTDAFPAPYQLDARRCLSYLTIEFAGPWPEPFRDAMGNRVYGCDDCLAVCPWNKFAAEAREHRLQARDALRGPPLGELAALDEAGFRARFSRSSIKRIGVERFRRNVLYAIGNSGDPDLIDAARPHLESPDPVVADAARWAIARLDTGRLSTGGPPSRG